MDPGEVMRGTLAIAGGALRASGARIRIIIPNDLLQMRGRMAALEQVLINLLVNALDAMEEAALAERRIEIDCEFSPEVDAVILALRDHGPGIPAEVQDRLFEPLFTTKPAGQGTGLGLSITYGTSIWREHHHGRSRPGWSANRTPAADRGIAKCAAQLAHMSLSQA